MSPMAEPPRLVGRLTAELCLSARQGPNALKEYELDLRGEPMPCSSSPGQPERSRLRAGVGRPMLGRAAPRVPASGAARRPEAARTNPNASRAQATSWGRWRTWESPRCVARLLGGVVGAEACPQNQFDVVDLSDNEIVKLDGFPPLPRLTTLLAHNNRIARLGASLAGACGQATHA